MSTGYVNLQLRPSTKVSLISSKFAEADLIELFSDVQQMVSQVPYPMTVPSTTPSPVKLPTSSTCVPLCCLFPRYTDTHLTQTTLLERGIF